MMKTKAAQSGESNLLVCYMYCLLLCSMLTCHQPACFCQRADLDGSHVEASCVPAMHSWTGTRPDILVLRVGCPCKFCVPHACRAFLDVCTKNAGYVPACLYNGYRYVVVFSLPNSQPSHTHSFVLLFLPLSCRAFFDECTKNPGYMLSGCKKSCKACGTAAAAAAGQAAAAAAAGQAQGSGAAAGGGEAVKTA
jgi:hypothetical protein